MNTQGLVNICRRVAMLPEGSRESLLYRLIGVLSVTDAGTSEIKAALEKEEAEAKEKEAA